MMNTRELSHRTGVPVSTLNLWVSQGLLRPAHTSYGKGYSHEFSEDNAAQALAIKLVRENFGDGAYAKVVLAEAIPQVRAGVERIRVPEFKMALA